MTTHLVRHSHFAHQRSLDCPGFSVALSRLAAILVSAVLGYQIKDSAGKRLLDAKFVNFVHFLVVVTWVAT
jgi:hypothetical protein